VLWQFTNLLRVLQRMRGDNNKRLRSFVVTIRVLLRFVPGALCES
jgi:hypothetical protein